MLYRLAAEIFDLIFPRICPGCDWNKPINKGIFCVKCHLDIPETELHLYPDNPFEAHFWGRFPLVAGSSLYYFIPGGITQVVLHNIKYRRAQRLAVDLGLHYASKLAESPRLQDLTHIVPVPLHWRKMRSRGFNQSEAFARGIAEGLKLPCIKTLLLRSRNTPSQTRKSRSERVENMSGAFYLNKKSQLRNCHFLLVDDVMTTGATLEACALTLLQIPGSKISLATIACGRI